MDEKKQNEKELTDAHVFDVRTMKSDNEMRSRATDIKKTETRPTAMFDEKFTSIPQKPKQEQIANPFLSEDPIEQKTSLGDGAFGLPDVPPLTQESMQQQAQSAQPPQGLPVFDEVPVAKENDFTAALNPSAVSDNFPPAKKGSHVTKVIMIAVVVVAMLGIAVAGGLLMRSRMNPPQEIIVADEKPITQEPIVEEEDSTAVYATDNPNYLSFDVESETVKGDIATELQTIRNNLTTQNESDPVSFIVTDKNDIPVSFHVFAMSAGMSFPEDVLSALEETFEMYAYDDPSAGVRFGFAVDVKNGVSLPQALAARELLLPQAFDPVMEKSKVGTSQVVFKDSTYSGQSIRYANLNPEETYSIDYTVMNNRLVVGTSKDTLRVIVDAIKNSTTYKPVTSETQL